jgi:hypothetical protein
MEFLCIIVQIQSVLGLDMRSEILSSMSKAVTVVAMEERTSRRARTRKANRQYQQMPLIHPLSFLRSLIHFQILIHFLVQLLAVPGHSAVI